MSEYPWNENNVTITWLTSLYNPFRVKAHHDNMSIAATMWFSCFNAVVIDTYVLFNPWAISE